MMDKETLQRANQKLAELETEYNDKRLPEDSALQQVNTYLGWFIPLISSLFFLVVGAIVSLDSLDTVGAPGALLAVVLSLFSCLLCAVWSRFESFRYRKYRDDLSFRTQGWGLQMVKHSQDFLKIVRPHVEEVEKDTETAIAALKGNEEFEKLTASFADGLLGLGPIFLPKQFVKRMNKARDKETREAIGEDAKKWMKDTFLLRRGPGRSALVLFYLSHVFFVVSMVGCVILAFFTLSGRPQTGL